MRTSVALFTLALAGGAVSCTSGGCDGSRAKPPEAPQTPATADPDAGGEVVAAVVPAGPTVDVPVTQTHGYLMVPPGALEKLNGALVAAERTDPHARVALLFFGDSHTAGDAMTSRVRSTFQARFGDAGRGLVQA